VVMKW